MSENKQTSFSVIREIACKLGVSSPESDEYIYQVDFLNAIKRAVSRNFKTMEELNAKITELEKLKNFKTYITSPAESLAGIAQRQLKNVDLWVEIARLNSNDYPDMSANDYYPVGTKLIIPKLP